MIYGFAVCPVTRQVLQTVFPTNELRVNNFFDVSDMAEGTASSHCSWS